MTIWQEGILIGLALVNCGLFLLACWQSFYKRNSYGPTRLLIPLGIFVWGDALIYGPFWVASSLLSFWLKDWFLFLLVVSVFAAVRGFGEAIFWINHQFSPKQIYPAKTCPGYSLVKNESIWFIYQIIAQCVTVIGVVASLYFGKLWLAGALGR